MATSALSRETLLSLIQSQLPTNGVGAIQASNLRSVLDQIVNFSDGSQFLTVKNPFGARGNGSVNDTTAQKDAWEYSQDNEGAPIGYPAGKYLLGISGSDQIPILIKDGQGPVIIGSGDGSWIQRANGYGDDSSGTEGGGGKRLIDMEDAEAVADGLIIKDLKVGPASDDLDQISGASIHLNMKNSTIDGLTGINSRGIMLFVEGEGNIIRGYRNLNASVYGGSALRVGGGSWNLFTELYIESADDCTFQSISADSKNIGDPTSNIFDGNRWLSCVVLAKQGAAYGLLTGKGSERVGSKTRFVRTTFEDPEFGTTLRVRSNNITPSVGDIVFVASAVGGGGLAAGDVNGQRTVLEIINGEGDFGISYGGTITSSDNVGHDTTVQSIRIGTTNGSAVVTLYVPNHGFVPTDTVTIVVLGWNTTGLTSGDVGGERNVTILDDNMLQFTAGANSSVTHAIGSTFADAGMKVGLFHAKTIRNASFEQMRGHSGDSTVTGHGGIGRKFYNTGSTGDMTVTVVDSDITHGDQLDRPMTNCQGVVGAVKLYTYRDVIREPRSVAMMFPSDIDTGFGIAAANLLEAHSPLWFAPALDQPTVIMDGGTCIIIGGEVRCNENADGMIFADSYTLDPFFDGDRIVDAATAGREGTPLQVEKVIMIGVKIRGIGNGQVGIRLGNVKYALIMGCEFTGASGATTWGCVNMRTPGAGQDIGTTNTAFLYNNTNDCTVANIIKNWIPNKGNTRDYLVEAPSYTAGRFYPEFAGSARTTTAVPAADTISYRLIKVSQKVTLTGLAARTVTGGAGSGIKMALYPVQNGIPQGAPIASDNTGQATTGSGTTQTAAVSVTLTPGVYAIMSKLTGTLPVMANIGNNGASTENFLGEAALTDARLTMRTLAHTYATAWPTLTGAEGWADSAVDGWPLVWLKL